MRGRRELARGVALAVLVATAVGAESEEHLLEGLGFGQSDQPIVVTADTLEYDYRGNVIVYRGDVEASQGSVHLKSETLTVTFAARGAGGGDGGGAGPLGVGAGRVAEIVAAGGVRIEDGTRWATGGRAVLDQTRRTLVLTEAPKLHDGSNEVQGDRVVVYLDEDRSVVEGGRRRVKAVLFPEGDAAATR